LTVDSRQVIGIALTIAIAALGAPAAAQQSAVDRQVESGWEALRLGDGDKAATVFYELLRRNPREAAFHFGAGVAAHLQGRETDAIASLTRALELNPKLVQASDLLGQLHYQQGDLDAAIRVYEQALPAGAGPPAMRMRLEEWRKEAAVHAKLAVRNDARFSIIFDGRSDQTLATRASAVLDRAFWTISQKIGTYPSNRIIVTLYTEQQFRDITRVPA
jgi:tetratricopeptide (TPR) repeat protein